MNLKDKTICILGAAKSGLAAARFALNRGARVKISDQCVVDLVTLPGGHKVETEVGHTEDFIADADLVVVSPGVPRNAQPIKWAEQAGIEVISEIELASRFCTKPIIAVTGSNGKTTTVTLIAQVIDHAGKRPCLCGNIGRPFISCIDQLDQYDYVVLEVSSFQLESISTFCPSIGVFLNFSQNHLDRHASLQEYFDAKARLFMNQTQEHHAIFKDKDERMYCLANEIDAQVSYISDSKENPNYAFVREVANILNIDQQVCDDVFDQFQGVEHRMERVATIDGVEVINDSKSTTVESGRWALSHIDKPIILIAGGRDKNSNFTTLQDVVKEKVKSMIVIGEATDKLSEAFHRSTVINPQPSLEHALKAAFDTASKGDAILFSPMCASFDMFDNFEQRGAVFKSLVMAVKS